MSDMLNTKVNEYAPRLYPKDTPAEATARLAGFEAGRQYEASLRDDVPATLIPAAGLASRIAKARQDISDDPNGWGAGAALKELSNIVDELSGK